VAIAVALWLVASPALPDQAPRPSIQEIHDQIKRLHWKRGPGTYALGDSHAQITLPQDAEIVTGADATRMAFLLQGIELPEIVAIAQWPKIDTSVDIDYHDEGFVTDEDWSDIDPDALLRDMRAARQAAADSRPNGPGLTYTIDWLIPPTYDPARKEARWAIAPRVNGELQVNLHVIKLGRYGYHRISWAGLPSGIDSMPRFLQTMLDSHSYDEGYRYADHAEGDKLTGFGIGALVRAVATGGKPDTGTIAATVGGGLLLAAGASFGILAALGGIGILFKRRFNRDSIHST
jgi:uncharacterized membrane-anchored protein